MYRRHRLAVVLPVHNEAPLLAETLARIPDFVDDIICVDDASTDASAAVLADFSRERRPITILRHRDNRGVGAATVTGYRHALSSGADIVALMDADGQMDSRDLPALLDALLDGPNDFVKGNRFAHPSIRRMPRRRYVGNRVLSALTRIGLGHAGPLDAQCGYTAFRTNGLRKLDLDRLFPRYGFPNDLLFEVAAKGLRFTSVPVRTIYGAEVSGINPFTVPWMILGLILRGWLRRIVRDNGAPGISPTVAE